jgi:putative component of toxin-antitoxin plasmid stabilization module
VEYFPPTARNEAGYQLDKVQHGLEPDDFKPMPTVGKGVWELRITDEAGQFRVIYIAKAKNPNNALIRPVQFCRATSVQAFYTVRKKLKVFRISSDKTSGCSIAEK